MPDKDLKFSESTVELLVNPDGYEALDVVVSPARKQAGVLWVKEDKSQSRVQVVDLNNITEVRTINIDQPITSIVVTDDGRAAALATSETEAPRLLRLDSHSDVLSEDLPRLLSVGLNNHLEPMTGVRWSGLDLPELWAQINGKWKKTRDIPLLALTRLHRFEYEPRSNSIFFNLADSDSPSRLTRISLSDGSVATVASDPDYDISDFAIDPETGEVDFYTTSNPDPKTSSVHFLGEGNARLIELGHLLKAHIVGVERSRKLDRWLVRIRSDREPESFVVFDWPTKSVLGRIRTELANAAQDRTYSLAESEFVRIPTRDGKSIDGFLTKKVHELPKWSTQKQLAQRPMIIYLHGGPARDDRKGYYEDVQFLASRGYAVLQINYRGSTGRGIGFESAPYQAFDQAPLDDIDSAIDWAVKEGVTTRGHIGVMGASFGGYLSTLMALHRPQGIACAVSLSGLYDLLQLEIPVQEIPESQRHVPGLTLFQSMTDQERFGDVRSPLAQLRLREMSPTYFTGNTTIPILLGHGTADAIAPFAGFATFLTKLRQAKSPVIAVKFTDEGHTLNVKSDSAFLNLTENFFSKCLGGLSRPLQSDEIATATSYMRVLIDTGFLPDLNKVVSKEQYELLDARTDVAP